MTGLLNQHDVAKLLGVSVKILEAWRSRGGGPPFIKVGSLTRYQLQDVQEWIDSRRVGSTSETR